jgi:hypothetical protein
MLNQHGTQRLYLHYGFDGWNDAETVLMSKTNHNTYATNVRVNGDRELNFCFKDGANNWDNNNGADWKVGIK